MNIRLLSKALWKGKWILILVPVVVAAIVFFLNNEEKRYKSKAQLATGFTAVNPSGVNGEKAGSEEMEVRFANVVETMESPLIIGLLSYELANHDLVEGAPFRTINHNPEVKILLSAKEKENAIEIFQKKLNKLELLSKAKPEEVNLQKLLQAYGYDYVSLRNNLNIKRAGYSDNVSIEFLSENPQLSAFVVNTITQEYIKYNNSLSINISGQSIDFYENLVNKTKEALDQKTAELNNFRTNNNVVNVDVESQSKFNQLAELELRKQQENQNMKRYQLELDNINKQLSGLVQGPAISSRGRDNNRIAELQAKIKEANQRYISSDRDPSILAIVEDLRRQLQIELGKSDVTPASIENKRTALLAQKNTAELNMEITQAALNQINGSIGNLKSNVSGLTNKGSTVESLTREVQKANEEYLAAVEKYNAAKNETIVSTTSMRQVVYGQPAISAEPTDAIRYTSLAGLISFAFCFFSIISVAAANPAVKTSSSFSRKTQLNPLGYINYIKTETITPEILNKRSSTRDEGFTLFKELLKKLRFEIENSGSKIFLVTSTKAQDGKTSIIVSLVSALIANGKRVLVIDTNFKNNALTKIYSAKPTLEAAVNSDMKTDDIITRTNYKNLEVIGCKGGHYSPSEIFPDNRFAQLLSQVAHQYDYIFMEGTFLNHYADSRELVTYVDKVVAIFSAKSTLKTSDRESIQYLKGIGHKLLGIVLNKVEKDHIDL
jgi:polysaccharide biosynthesis transport protein